MQRFLEPSVNRTLSLLQQSLNECRSSDVKVEVIKSGAQLPCDICIR